MPYMVIVKKHCISCHHNVSLFEFWAIGTAKLRNAHCFVIGQIIFISHLSKACTSEVKSNPNLELMFEIYAYHQSTSSYTWNGRSRFLKACIVQFTIDFQCISNFLKLQNAIK